MNNFTITAVLSALLFLPIHAGAEEPAEAIDLSGLEPVSETRLDEAFARSGSALDQYEAVHVTAPEVSFRENWMRDQNRQRSGARINEKDMDLIRERVSRQFVSLLEAEFVERGYEVVAEPAAGVLVFDTQVTELDVVGPDTAPATQVQTYSEYSGSMTLVAQLLDGASNELLFWSSDKQRDLQRGFLESRTRVTNSRDFKLKIRSWAEDLFDTLESD